MQLHITRCVIGANSLLVMLNGMPSLPQLTFKDVDVMGDADFKISALFGQLIMLTFEDVDVRDPDFEISALPTTLRLAIDTDGAHTQQINGVYKLTADDIGKLRCCLSDIKQVSDSFEDLPEYKSGPKSDSESESES